MVAVSFLLVGFSLYKIKVISYSPHAEGPFLIFTEDEGSICCDI